MKTFLVLFLIILFSSKNILFAQEQLTPFVLSPFIGEKLDRVEESYFKLFSGVTSFNEATFYIKADSSLMVNIKGYHHNVFIDSTMSCILTLNEIRNSINQIILKDIKGNRVQELEFKTISDSTYEGTVYLFNEDKIKLIKQDYLSKNYFVDEKDFFEILDYSNVKSITNFENNDGVKIVGSIIGMVAGGLIGYVLAPEPYFKEPTTLGEWLMDHNGFEVNHETTYTIIGMLIGGVIGYGIGHLIKVPIEYETTDPEVRKIIRDNSLLPSGL